MKNRVALYFARLNPPPAGEGQPVPSLTLVSRLEIGGEVVTAIARNFSRADVARCRLCPDCTAINGTCLIQISDYVPDDRAPLYRIDR